MSPLVGLVERNLDGLVAFSSVTAGWYRQLLGGNRTDTFTRFERDAIDTPAARGIARPGRRAATSRLVPSTATTMLRARETRGSIHAREECPGCERHGQTLWAPRQRAPHRPRRPSSTGCATPPTVTAYAFEVRTMIVSPSRTASPHRAAPGRCCRYHARNLQRKFPRCFPTRSPGAVHPRMTECRRGGNADARVTPITPAEARPRR